MSARRVHGRLRALTLEERRHKAARNDRRGRDRAYVPTARASGPTATPYLPPMDEALERARSAGEGHGRDEGGRLGKQLRQFVDAFLPRLAARRSAGGDR